MNYQFVVYGYNTLKALSQLIKNLKLYNSDVILFHSDFVGQLQFSYEAIMDIVFESESYGRKATTFLLLELVKLGFKVRELENLRKQGFQFYVDSRIYIANVINFTDSEVVKRFCSFCFN